MTGDATRRPRRRRAALLAVGFLLIGLGLLLYSANYLTNRSTSSNAAPAVTASPALSRSAVAILPQETATPGDTTPTPQISYIAVPTYVPVPVPAQETGWLPLITTVSGLIASLAGIVSAFVSMRRPR